MPKRKRDRLDFGSQMDRQGRAAVWMVWGKNEGALTPAQAKSVGMGLIAAAVEAESDAALLVWLQSGGIEPRQAEQMVLQVRHFREKARGTLGNACEIAADGSAIQEDAEDPSSSLVIPHSQGLILP